MQAQNLPQFTNFVCSEAEIDFQLAMKDLQSLNDERSKTTLSSNEFPLTNTFVIVMVKNGYVLQPKVDKPPMKTNSLWKDYTIPLLEVGSRTESLAHTSANQTTTVSDPGSIDQWVEGIESIINPFLPAESSSSNHTVEYVPHVEINAPYKVNKKVRTVKGAPALKTPPLDVRHMIPEANRVNETDADDQPLVDILPDPPPIDAPFIPPLSSENHPINRTTAWASSIVTGQPSFGGLIDLSEPIKDTLRADTPKNKLKFTMNQRAPSKSIHVNSRSMKAYEEASLRLLNLALPRSGPLRFQIDFGRLLLIPNTRSTEFRNDIFLGQEWAKVLPKNKRPQTTFTPRQVVHLAYVSI